MINKAASVDISQALKSQPLPLFLLVDPGGESLLDDPASRPLQTSRQLVHLVRKQKRYMSGEYSRLHSGALPIL